MIIREQAAIILGQIGLPEAVSVIEKLTKTIQDKESSLVVKDKCIFTIGKLADACDNSVFLK